MIENTQSRPTDIFVVGTGIIPGMHLTREAEAVFRASKQILYVDQSFGFQSLLSRYCSNVLNLYPLCYAEGANRIDAYRLMAAKVIEAALEKGPVSFALYGHPLVYTFPPFIVAAVANLVDLRVRILPGISSLDTLFVDLMLDPCTHGIQMYEATDLLLRRRPLQPDVPCLIWQIGTVESRLFSVKGSDGNRFSRIRKYLEEFYPPNHKMVAVYSPNIPLSGPTKTEFRLSEIEEVAGDLHQGVTVYVPPVSSRGVVDPDLLGAMDSVTHLASLTARNE